MNLAPTEEQALLDASVRDVLRAEYDFARRRDSLRAPHGCAPARWQQFAALGWLGLRVPEAHGGIGAGLFEAGLLQRAFGRHLVVEPFAASALLATPLLARLGRAPQCAAWLPALLDGRRRAALAHEEAASAAAAAAPGPVRAERHGDGWLLEGGRRLVPGAAGADLLLVSAQVPDGQRVFLLRPDTPGVQLQPARTVDDGWAADLRLQAVQLDAEALLGEDRDATAALREAWAWDLVGRCWDASGAMAAALEHTTTHVRTREQFGQPLAQFQVVQHRLAEMAVCCEEALASCELAALCIDAGAADAPLLAAMARSKVGREARFVARQAVQLHGAMGVTDALPVAAWFRRLTAFQQQGGADTVHAGAYGAAALAGQVGGRSSTLATLEGGG